MACRAGSSGLGATGVGAACCPGALAGAATGAAVACCSIAVAGAAMETGAGAAGWPGLGCAVVWACIAAGASVARIDAAAGTGCCAATGSAAAAAVVCAVACGAGEGAATGAAAVGLAGAAAGAVAAVGAGVYVAKNGGFGNKEQNTSQSAAVKQYEVPDFVSAGYTQSDIENNGAWNKQFKLTFVSKYSTDVEEGIVFEQSVESGKKVDEQTEIQLTVSKGVQTESVPNVAGQSLDDAKKTLEDKGFKVSTVEIYNDGSHEADTVKESYASAPAAGETVAVGEEIVLQVYGEVQTTTAVEPENDIGTD